MYIGTFFLFYAYRATHNRRRYVPAHDKCDIGPSHCVVRLKCVRKLIIRSRARAREKERNNPTASQKKNDEFLFFAISLSYKTIVFSLSERLYRAARTRRGKHHGSENVARARADYL